jgi:hypothetical protein
MGCRNHTLDHNIAVQGSNHLNFYQKQNSCNWLNNKVKKEFYDLLRFSLAILFLKTIFNKISLGIKILILQDLENLHLKIT